MDSLPTHTEFEYLLVTLDNGYPAWQVVPYRCSDYDHELDSFVWRPVEEAIMFFDTEAEALEHINKYGVLSNAFKNKLN